ncbi:spore cortex biosynthesis protein YabQ [Zongyangia hominis]|uniref:Spore cortex biosynthesis protein YabQ n=1 Tax=Zongyangia hominis TaxID=2763677 RepID=A0A926EDK7_9FIRM|nr:spore cortex biosynthesis protein YabQ [Zongyangia hominis]MBC8569802.1 spore cortex biosynthesis protein YabQ [Zongyangia hominis]
MLSQQTQVFLYACLIGAGLGAFYDVFRMIRLAVKNSAVIVFIEDALFFAVCALVTFFYMMQAMGGQLRFFILLGEFLGAVIYYFTIGALVMKISKLIIRGIKAVLHFLFRIFIRPILLFLQWIGKKLQKLFSKCTAPLKKFGTNAKFRLKQQRVLLYNLLKPHPKQKKKKRRARKEGKNSGRKTRKNG